MRYLYIGLVLACLAFAYLYLYHRDSLGPLFEEDDPDVKVLHRERSEFGSIRVEEEHRLFLMKDGLARKSPQRKLLYDGTLHDMQFPTTDFELVQILAPFLQVNRALGTACWYDLGLYEVPNRLEPATYYHRIGPMGEFFAAVCSGPHERAPVAFIGLGAGSVAAHARPDQPITFYEVDPALIRVARGHFSFLRDSPAKINFVEGEPREKLALAPDQQYRLIVVNPVGGPFTPANCMTREAIQLFLRKLTDDGVVALHISNRNLEQAPVLGNIVRDLKVAGLYQFDDRGEILGKNYSEWVLIAKQAKNFGALLKNEHWETLKPNPAFPLWTDQNQDLKAARRKK